MLADNDTSLARCVGDEEAVGGREASAGDGRHRVLILAERRNIEGDGAGVGGVEVEGLSSANGLNRGPRGAGAHVAHLQAAPHAGLRAVRAAQNVRAEALVTV